MQSKILQKDRDDLIALYRSMSPSKRLAAFFNHSQLMAQVYQAGVDFRKNFPPSQNHKQLKKDHES